jgi:hypothetical protein
MYNYSLFKIIKNLLLFKRIENFSIVLGSSNLVKCFENALKEEIPESSVEKELSELDSISISDKVSM